MSDPIIERLKYNIPELKYDGENYSSWSALCENAIYEAGCEDDVFGSVKEADAPTMAVDTS